MVDCVGMKLTIYYNQSNDVLTTRLLCDGKLWLYFIDEIRTSTWVVESDVDATRICLGPTVLYEFYEDHVYA